LLNTLCHRLGDETNPDRMQSFAKRTDFVMM
jgi:hypothetical protein